MNCDEDELAKRESALDLLAEARVANSVVTTALHAFACSTEDDMVLSKDAAFGLWRLSAESAEKVASACNKLGLSCRTA